MDHAVEQPTITAVQPPSYQVAWEYVLAQLREDVGSANYRSYVSALRPLSFKEGIYRVGAETSATRDWARSRLTRKLGGLLELVLSQKVDVRFTLITGDERHGWVEVPDELLPVTTQAQAVTADRPENGTANAGGLNGASSTPEVVSSSQGGEADTRDNAVALDPVNTISLSTADTATITRTSNGNGTSKGSKKKAQPSTPEQPSPRKIQLQRAYGTERARVVQPERGMFLTLYFFNNWLPLLGHSAMTAIIAARTLCYWNPLTGEMRNVVETDMGELARRAAVSVRTVKDVLNNELVKKYFLRYKVRRVMTPNGVRTAGIILQVRMDDPLTPEDQAEHNLPEDERWYTADFEDEEEE